MPSRDPARRLGDIIKAIDDIHQFIADAGGVDAAMQGSALHLAAIERRLSVLSEAASKLGQQAEAMEPGIRWDKIRGLGNYLRHNYDDLNEDILVDIVRNGLDPLRDACVRARETLRSA